MKNNLLQKKINEIQKEYLSLLVSIKKRLSPEELIYIVEEISLFWYSKKQIVSLFLENAAVDGDCYVFLDCNYLRFQDKDEFSFLTLGCKHIMDDQLAAYSPNIKEENFEQFKSQFEKIIDNNITILKSYKDKIIVLPIFFYAYDGLLKDAKEIARMLFIRAFQDNTMTMEKYYHSFKSFKDISDALLPYIRDQLSFSDREDPSYTCEEKIIFFATKNAFLFNGKSAPEIFFMMLHSMFSRALIIIQFCDRFKLIPYLNHDITFFYIGILMPMLLQKEAIVNQDIFLKSIIVKVLHPMLDEEKLKQMSLEEYRKTILDYDFDCKINVDLAGCTPLKFKIKKIEEVLRRHLTTIFGPEICKTKLSYDK